MPIESQDLFNEKLCNVLLKYQDLPQFAELKLTDVNQQGFDEDTPFHVACRQGSLEDFDIMIAAGADVTKQGDLGNTPMHEAASFGHAAIVRKLLEVGADPNLVNELGETPRDRAVLGKHRDVLAVFDRLEGK